MNVKKVEISIDGKKNDLRIIKNKNGQDCIDFREFTNLTGLYSYDPELKNTAITKSNITYIDSNNGELFYRGYNIRDLVEHSSFVETSYLLWNGSLPNETDLNAFSQTLKKHSMIHESMRQFFDAFPGEAHPLAILSVMVTALSSYYKAGFDRNIEIGIDIRARLLAKVRTLAAWSYKKSVGQPVIYPRDELPYCTNFLNMMFAFPTEHYDVATENDKLLNQILILYSDHGLNAATATVRLVGSTRANLFASISAGLSTLWGLRESGAKTPPNVFIREMIEQDIAVAEYFKPFTSGKKTWNYIGFGHNRYVTKDPRAVIAKEIFHKNLDFRPRMKNDEFIQKALEIEDFAENNKSFIENNKYPNLDFYSSLLLHMIKIPREMNLVIRAMGKLNGWLAHWREQKDINSLAFRPQQIYEGKINNEYIKLNKR